MATSRAPRPRPARRSGWLLAGLALAAAWAAGPALRAFAPGRGGPRLGARSRRGLVARAAEAAEGGEEKRPLSSLQVGDVLTGVVLNHPSFGAFVDVGAEVDGLVFNEELGDGMPMSRLKKGTKVYPKVQQIDDGKLWLTLRSGDLDRPSHDRTWKGLDNLSVWESVPADEWFEGEVTSFLLGKGAFVKVSAPGSLEPSKGLLQVQEFGEGIMDKIVWGMKVRVRVLACDAANKRLDLTMKDP